MAIFLAFIAYLGGMLVLAAALHYPLYSLLSEWFTVRPDRLMYRSAMVFAAIGLWPFMRSLGLADRAAAGFGLPKGQFWITLGKGWLAGIVILLALSLALLALHLRLPHLEIPMAKIAKVAATGLIGGLLVGFIEETFFRGVMHSGLRRRLPVWTTISLTSALYAALHFMRPPHMTANDPVQWDTGWRLLAGMFDRFADPLSLVDSFTALFMVGVFLSLVRERTGNIALCIGLHAGWVLVIKLTLLLSVPAKNADLAFLTGSYDGIIGWLAAAWIGGLAWLFQRHYHPETRQNRSS